MIVFCYIFLLKLMLLYILNHTCFPVVSTTEEPPFIMHHLSPADDEVPGTSRGDNPYEEIKDEDLGIKEINLSYILFNISSA